MAVEQVVAQDQDGRRAGQELAADDQRLRQPARVRLDGVLQPQPPLATVFEQLLKDRGVARRRDDQKYRAPRQHQRAQRIVNHRLVVDRQQLLRHRTRRWIQARAGAAGQDDAAPLDCARCSMRLPAWLI